MSGSRAIFSLTCRLRPQSLLGKQVFVQIAMEWIPQLAPCPTEYQIDFLTSLAISLATTKLPLVTTSPSWLTGTEELLSLTRQMLKLTVRDNQLRNARLYQAEGCVYYAKKNFEEAYSKFAQALELSQRSMGEVHSYATELMVDMAHAMLFLRRWGDVVHIGKAAINCEIAISKDPLRLGKAFSIYAEGHLGEGEMRLAYENMKRR